MKSSAQKEKATFISECGLYLCRQRPTLPHSFPCSTIGPAGLNFRVRDGNGWNPRGMITDFVSQLPERIPSDRAPLLSSAAHARSFKELEDNASRLNRLVLRKSTSQSIS